MHSDRPSLFCPQQVLSPPHAACADYRLRLGWPVRVDELTQQVVLLTGEELTSRVQAGVRVVVVDMPATLGSRVSSVLWTRSLPAVVFAVQRLVYVHPYRHTRWRFLAAVTPDATQCGDPTALPIPLPDVQVVTGVAVALPLRREDRTTEHTQRITNGHDSTAAGLSWVSPPPAGGTENVSLPRLTAVLAALLDKKNRDCGRGVVILQERHAELSEQLTEL